MGWLDAWRWPAPAPVDDAPIERDVAPLEGTNISLFNSIIPNWWAENITSTAMYGTPQLADRVWVASRCQQLNAQQLASMPLVFHGPDGAEPAWMSNPDPHWFPNGVGDAIFSIVDQLYAYGFACIYVTDIYADGYPRTWTVLASCDVNIELKDGSRAYKLGEEQLDANRVVQIDRNPGTRLHGTSALRAYAQKSYGLLAAGNQSMSVSQGGIPQFYLKSERKMDKAQAEALQAQWMTAVASRNGAPPVIPPEIAPTEMSFNPSDLALLETQEWDARVIATAYGVPAVLLNMSLQGGLTYQNPMALMQMWWLTELRTTAKRIDDAFSAQMLPRGQWVSIDASDITSPALTATSAADDTQASQNQQQQQQPPPPPPVANASPAQQPGRLSAVTG